MPVRRGGDSVGQTALKWAGAAPTGVLLRAVTKFLYRAPEKRAPAALEVDYFW